VTDIPFVLCDNVGWGDFGFVGDYYKNIAKYPNIKTAEFTGYQ
jgi:hypothetical protein